MDIITYWDWRAWTLVITLLLWLGWALWRLLSALAFRWLLLPRMLRRHGWVDRGDKSRFDRAAFRQEDRRRRRQGSALLRKGIRGIREGYATGVFAKSHYSRPQTVLDIVGTRHGHEFLAQQHRRYELSITGGHRQRSARHRSTLEVRFPDLSLPSGTISVTLLTGNVRVSGIPQTPAPERFVKRHRLYGRAYAVSPGAISVHLPGRLSRGRLFRGINLLVELADELSVHRLR